MSNFRDNPSDAEQEREWPKEDQRRFRRRFFIGVGGFLLDLLIMVGLFTEVLPPFGKWTMASIAFLILSLPFLIVFLLNGLSQGRDHRPSVMQAFAAGGRGS